MTDIQLIHGDCLEKMNDIPDKSIDMVLCDLPYGTTKCKWDNVIPFTPMWEQINRVIKPNGAIILFASQPFTTLLISSNMAQFKYSLIWEKNVPTGMTSAKYRPMKYFEDICIFYEKQPTYNPILKAREGKGKSCYNYNHYCGNSNHVSLEKQPKRYDPDFVRPSNVLEFKVVPNRNGKLHPTQKPVDLLEYLIKTYTNENDTVLDFTMGSGSTGVACVNTNRKFIGIELDEKYYDISCKRIKEAINEKKQQLF
jgi:site-specific DNA-methyltransferase (adenine-specific)